MKYPKWKYAWNPRDGFRSMLVASAELEAQISAEWVDDPYAFGIKVVPYPAELTAAGIVHHPTQADGNGRHPYGPAPTAAGINQAGFGTRRTLQ